MGKKMDGKKIHAVERFRACNHCQRENMDSENMDSENVDRHCQGTCG